MESTTFRRAALLVLILTVILIGGYELFLRQSGYQISYDDTESLFADKRRKIYLPREDATVFAGSSRIKYDINTELWTKLTGEIPVQLANVGSSPIPVLNDLAADTLFKGKILVDVTESILYDLTGRSFKRPKKNLSFCKKETPAQRFSFHINTILESMFVFLDKDNFSLSPLLELIPIPARKKDFPPYPIEFERVNFARQSMLTDRFADTDTAGVRQMKEVWVSIMGFGAKEKPLPRNVLDSFMMEIKKQVTAITSRGGEVVFIRPPSSGPIWEAECMSFPKDSYWQKLLDITGCKGIHFFDYASMNQFSCTEYSHLRQSDAKIFTENIIHILSNEIGWKFKSSIH